MTRNVISNACRITGGLLALNIIAVAASAATLELGNFDKRRDVSIRSESGRAAEVDAAVARMKSLIPDVRIEFDDLLKAPKSIVNSQGLLTGLANEDELLDPGTEKGVPPGERESPSEPIERFIESNRDFFGFGPEVLASAQLSRDSQSGSNSFRTLVWEQFLDGIPIFESILSGHLTGRGELISLSSLFIPNPEGAADAGTPNRAVVQVAPLVSASEAVETAATNITESFPVTDVSPIDSVPNGLDQKQRFSASCLLGEATASLVWLPMGSGRMRLCWKIILTGKTRGELFQVLVDAETREVQVRHCWTFRLTSATFKVFTNDSPSPFSPGYTSPTNAQPALLGSAPSHGRTLVTLTALSTNASPNGWINDGVNETLGNNVDARLDVDGDDVFDAVSDRRPTGNPSRYFSFDLDLSQAPPVLDTNQMTAPNSNQDAAVVNAFYWCNWAHDKLYDLGFTESAGNAQFDNFGRGGVGGDRVIADVQNGGGAGGFTPDGTSPRLSMPVYTYTNDLFRDRAFDSEAILHEYSHIMMQRLVGGGIAISAEQTKALNEGWADFLSMALLSESSDNLSGNYAYAAYAAWNPPNFLENYYYGVRLYPYSIEMSKNPVTLGDIAQERLYPGIPSNPAYPGNVFSQAEIAGQVWAVALWEARANLISAHGFAIGNQTILQLVVDGMKFCPPNPNYLQARDAILLADRVNHSGTNSTNLWVAFAKRGMGYSAVCSSSYGLAAVTEAFDLPPVSPWSFTSGGTIYSSPAIGPDGTIYFGSTDSKFHAINPDKTIKWQYTGGSFFNSSPAIGIDGTIFVGCYDNYLYAFNPNGTVLWKTNTGGQIRSSPAIATNGTVYVGTRNSTKSLIAVNPANGSINWSKNLGNSCDSSPAVAADGSIYIGCNDGKLYAFDSSGNTNTGWPFTVGGGSVLSSPSVAADGTVYIGSSDGKLYAINPNGTAKWSQPFNTGSGSIIRSSPVISTNGIVFFGCQDAKVYAVKPDGSSYWAQPFTTGDDIRSSPALGADGTIFVGSDNGNLHALNTNGTERWFVSVGAGIFSSPVIGENGMIYFGSVNSKLYGIPSGTFSMGGQWPGFLRNARHTANIASVILRSCHVAFDPDSEDQDMVTFNIYGLDGTYTIESSTDLSTWSTAGTCTISNSGGSFAIGRAGDYRFYRAKNGNIKSLNAVGYVILRPSAGNSMIANQLDSGINVMGSLFRAVPDGTQITKFNSSSQQFGTVNTFDSVDWQWLDPFMTFSPGEGGFIANNTGSALQLLLTGEVMQGWFKTPIPNALSINSSKIPRAGGITAVLGFVPVPGDQIKLYRSGSYSVYTYDEIESDWLPSQPSILVGESFWIETTSPRDWTNSFKIW